MPRVTVASFNAHYGYDTRGRAFDVAQVCRRLAADLIVIQERWAPDGADHELVELAREEGYQVTDEPMGRARIRNGRPRLVPEGAAGEGHLVISMLSRLPLRSVSVLEMIHLRLDSAPRRFALRAEAEVEGIPFVYVGTHLDHLTHGSPWQLRDLARRLPPPEQPTALAGDMNMWGPVLALLLPGWRRAVRGRSWPRALPHSQIDHIVANRSVRPVSGAVLRTGRSDHLPVRAVLDI